MVPRTQSRRSSRSSPSAPPPSAAPFLPCFPGDCSETYRSLPSRLVLRPTDTTKRSCPERIPCTLSAECERAPTSSSPQQRGITDVCCRENANDRNHAKLPRQKTQNAVENPSCLLLGSMGGVVTFPSIPRSRLLK